MITHMVLPCFATIISYRLIVKSGRAWELQELRLKSWEDLHSLWWICCKERNRLATEDHERKRLNVAGEVEAHERDMVVGNISSQMS